MGTGSSYFLELSGPDLPDTVSGATTATYDVVAEHYLSWDSGGDDRWTSGPMASTDTVDGSRIVNYWGNYSNTGDTAIYTMGDGATIDYADAPGNNETHFIQLEDGRIFAMVRGSHDTVTEMASTLNANGTGVTEIAITGLRSSGGNQLMWNNVSIGVMLPAPCFTAGTLIDTSNGPVPVETLQAGDLIRTKDHGFQPVKWVGGSRVMDAPVRIAKGTFGNARDLVVSPRHRMLLKGWQMGLLFNHDEAFAAAKDMQNGTTITMEPEGWVTYYHILLDRHEVVYAEGAETESFFPDEASLNGMAKATREELAQTVDLSTFGRTVRPTLTANQAMYLSHNMDLLEDTPDQIAAQ